MTSILIVNSLLLGLGTAVAATLLGTGVATAALGSGRRGRMAWMAAGMATLALPPFLVTETWLNLLGPEGPWHAWFPIDLNSLGGVVVLLTLGLWPIPFLLVLGCWERLQTGHLETYPGLRGSRFLRFLLLPMGRDGILHGAFLVFVLALNQFAVPAILQLPVFPVEFWIRLNTSLDYAGALQCSLPMVLAPLLLVVLLRRRAVPWPRWRARVPPATIRGTLGGQVFVGVAVAASLVLAISLVLPVGRLVAMPRTWTDFPGAVAASGDAIRNSLALAAGIGGLVAVFGWLTSRWRHGWVGWAFFLMPGMLLALGLSHLFSRYGGGAVAGTWVAVIAALAIRYGVIGWALARIARNAEDRGPVDWVQGFGGGRWAVWRYARWPQHAAVLTGGALVVYLLVLWDVETLVMIIPPGGETVALKVFNLLHYGHNSQVAALCLVLLIAALAPLLATLMARSAAAWRRRKSFLLLNLVLGVFAGTGCRPHANPNSAFTSAVFESVASIGRRGVGPGELNKPRSLALDARDNLYVVDMTGRVQKFNPQGAFLDSWQMPETDRGKPKGMCRDAEGNIVVVEPHYDRINHYSPGGVLVRQWGRSGIRPGELHLPRAIAQNSRGEFVVSEYGHHDRIQVFSPDGKTLIRAFGSPGPGKGEFNRPEGLGLDAEDRIYVADSCNHRIQVFAPDGSWLRCFGSPGKGLGELSYPYDVRVGPHGLIYVCEFGNNRLQVFNAEGRPLELIGHAGSRPGEFFNPWSLDLDSHGNLYVADSRNHRVQKLIRRKP